MFDKYILINIALMAWKGNEKEEIYSETEDLSSYT